MALPMGWPGQLLLAGSLLAALPGATQPTTEDAKLPRCPAGWRLDVVLRSPRLRHPSVVCCARTGGSSSPRTRWTSARHGPT